MGQRRVRFSVWAEFEPGMDHLEGIVAKSKCKSEEGGERAPFRRNGAPIANYFPSKKTQIWKDFHEVWAKEEFDLVYGPNLNPEWITWKELSLSPSVKVKEEEVKKEKY